MLAHVDLCSGIGGFALGFQWAGLSRPVLFCDIEEWSRKVLAKHWPDVPIAEDVKELASDPRRLVPDCDILSCGYPCQPFSQAGVRRGEEDDRHIWPEIFTIVQAKRPAWCVFENVSGHISLGLDQVLSDLESKGYAVQPFVVPACAVDAPHRRDRVWIIAAHADGESESDVTRYGEEGQWLVADANGERLQGHFEQQTKSADTFVGCGENLADADCVRGENQPRHQANRQKQQLNGSSNGAAKNVADADSAGFKKQWRPQPAQQKHEAIERSGFWLPEPSMGGTLSNGLSAWMDEPKDIPRVATGVKQRAARLKGLGNAIVPQIAMQIGLTIKAVENG